MRTQVHIHMQLKRNNKVFNCTPPYPEAIFKTAVSKAAEFNYVGKHFDQNKF